MAAPKDLFGYDRTQYTLELDPDGINLLREFGGWCWARIVVALLFIACFPLR